jgi:hypothetical protein
MLNESIEPLDTHILTCQLGNRTIVIERVLPNKEYIGSWLMWGSADEFNKRIGNVIQTFDDGEVRQYTFTSPSEALQIVVRKSDEAPIQERNPDLPTYLDVRDCKNGGVPVMKSWDVIRMSGNAKFFDDIIVDKTFDPSDDFSTDSSLDTIYGDPDESIN